MKVSIVIPVYNEKEFVLKILEKIKQVDFNGLGKEIILVDDFSTDGTREILAELGPDYKVIYHDKNKGKGGALQTGFKSVTGDIVAIQDADLEYDPQDLVKLVELITTKQAQVVYGSRMSGKNPIGHIAYYAGNQLISWVTRVLYGVKLADVETCYKVFRKEVLEKLSLTQNDFGFEIEFTVQVLKNKFAIKELPISYAPRKFAEGKKINWVDGVKAIWLLFIYKIK